MTNRLAIMLGVSLIGAIVADAVLNDSVAVVFVLKKLALLIEYLAFWR